MVLVSIFSSPVKRSLVKPGLLDPSATKDLLPRHTYRRSGHLTRRADLTFNGTQNGHYRVLERLPVTYEVACVAGMSASFRASWQHAAAGQDLNIRTPCRRDANACGPAETGSWLRSLPWRDSYAPVARVWLNWALTLCCLGGH